MFRRHRRLRKNAVIRDMVRETVLDKNDFIYPIFVVEGENVKKEIPSLYNNYHYSIDRLDEIVSDMHSAGVKSVILFGIPDHKDEVGSSAYDKDGIIQRAIRKLRELDSELFIITDVCMCEYTDHGHCGIVHNHEVDNDETIKYIAKTALSHAEAGADMVAPSDMMDGRVQEIRKALDENGYKDVSIMAYSAKYCSAFYGPFRDAADSAPKFGNRRGYQMDPGNIREAMLEIEDDIKEGADIIMVKPALPYLDVIRWARDRFDVPVAAYNVSGEFAMVKAAAKEGLIDEKAVAKEMLTSIKRSGAKMIITYYALDICRWLEEDR
ncbi:MAG: porphobilinogen synthase [Clostridium sp.]|jgi:porphobilinogen synthase|uniref:porphobilinogen synthase n=1 Tax=Clostridium sp. TaxID=1506 RepID=UPI0025C30EC3|nr:porphobilinogen synthase [Clostridium sp.]MCH3962922.1 porphobilinogen synthase [Clostridium sp.]MCI1715663.1 porphobilinogen synthase [Clostridium sp.]MCI1800133.1 porphobilinogen synthase [Clostridium sp.]MCI1814046.1 porphobilinogen synthase [Clostridium sp.]MCI1870944.1 porphobilinogen synthase [Clostridium sp.]